MSIQAPLPYERKRKVSEKRMKSSFDGPVFPASVGNEDHGSGGMYVGGWQVQGMCLYICMYMYIQREENIHCKEITKIK